MTLSKSADVVDDSSTAVVITSSMQSLNTVDISPAAICKSSLTVAAKNKSSRRRSNSCTSYDVIVHRQRTADVRDKTPIAVTQQQLNSDDSLPNASSFWTSTGHCNDAMLSKSNCNKSTSNDESSDETEILPLFQRLTLNAVEKKNGLSQNYCRSKTGTATAPEICKHGKTQIAKHVHSDSDAHSGTNRRRDKLRRQVAAILSDDIFTDDEPEQAIDAINNNSGEASAFALEKQCLKENNFAIRKADDEKQDRVETPLHNCDRRDSYRIPWSSRHVGNFLLETSIIDDLNSGSDDSLEIIHDKETHLSCKSFSMESLRDDDVVGRMKSQVSMKLNSSKLPAVNEADKCQTPQLFSVPLAERLRRREDDEYKMAGQEMNQSDSLLEHYMASMNLDSAVATDASVVLCD